MTNQESKRFEAESLLRQARQDPYGWDLLSLEKLLDLWDFVEERYEDAQGWEVRHRYHMEHKDLNVVLYSYRKVGSSLVQLVVRLIDKLKERQKAGSK